MQTLALAFRLPEEAPRHPNWRPSPYSFETVLPLVFTTHILVPSKATPTGPLPTLNAPICVPAVCWVMGVGLLHGMCRPLSGTSLAVGSADQFVAGATPLVLAPAAARQRSFRPTRPFGVTRRGVSRRPRLIMSLAARPWRRRAAMASMYGSTCPNQAFNPAQR